MAQIAAASRPRARASLLACVLLLIVVVAVATEAHPAKGVRHKKRRHGSAANRRLMAVQRDAAAVRRRQHRHDRSLHLRDAVNVTLCKYTVRDDVMEGRVPRTIRYVRCVDNGCRCKVVNHIGTYTCTQLVTNMSVTIHDEQTELAGVPYACVCASQIGVEASGTYPKDIVS
jgi:hypothetical protein